MYGIITVFSLLCDFLNNFFLAYFAARIQYIIPITKYALIDYFISKAFSKQEAINISFGGVKVIREFLLCGRQSVLTLVLFQGQLCIE